MEKPNGKIKQAKTPTFFKHFSPSFLTTKLRVFFHFFSTQVSCIYKRTFWHSNTKQSLGHKEHKVSSLTEALSDLGSFPSATLIVSTNEHLFILRKTFVTLLSPCYTSNWAQEEAKASVLMSQPQEDGHMHIRAHSHPLASLRTLHKIKIKT